MSFREFWSDNKTKTLGTATALIAATLSMVALGMFDATETSPALISEYWQRWLTIVLSLANVASGGGTIAVGFSNTTRERVAISEANIEIAKAEQAVAMKTAIESTPGTGGE